MKKILLIAWLCVCLMQVYAQEVATLYHAAQDSTSIYYGMDAFKDAYKASADGDVITLSSGTFHSCDITKEITIRGAGMQADTVNNIAPTVLMGDFQVYSQDKHPNHRLSMEGINHFAVMYVKANSGPNRTLYDARFEKCRFRDVKTDYYSGPYYSYFRNVVFVQCRIYNIDLLGSATFYNCIVNNVDQLRNGSNKDYEMPFTSFNFSNCCVLALDSYAFNHSAVENSTFYNCVLVGNVPLSATNTAFNCLAYYYGSDSTKTMFSNLADYIDNHNHSFNSVQAIFKTYTGDNLSDSENFELQDSIKTKYQGIDDTQVGIYGGVAPFTPEVSFPVVSTLKVSPKSDESGKLKVEMQVGNSK